MIEIDTKSIINGSIGTKKWIGVTFSIFNDDDIWYLVDQNVGDGGGGGRILCNEWRKKTVSFLHNPTWKIYRSNLMLELSLSIKQDKQNI